MKRKQPEKIVRPCGCKKKCNYQFCFGTGVMVLLGKIGTAIEAKKRIRGMKKKDDKTFQFEEFCKDGNAWVTREIPIVDFQAILAP